MESGTLTELRHLRRSTISVTLDGEPTALNTQLSAIPGVHDLTTAGQRATFQVDEAALAPVMQTLSPLNPRSLVSSPPSLEELFLRHYGLQRAGDSK